MTDAFVFHDGTTAHTPQQLLEALRRVDKNAASHHIRSDANDYANWMRHAIGNEDLARKLEKCRSVTQVIAVLQDEHTRPKQVAGRPDRDTLTVPPLGPHGDKPIPKTIQPEGPRRPQMIPPPRRGLKPFILGLVLGMLIGAVGAILWL